MNIKHPSLVIFCKRPKLNQGKQRLVEDSDTESAFTIAKALLACALEDARNWHGPVMLACSNSEDMLWAQSLPLKAQVISQLPLVESDSLTQNNLNASANLGDRLNYIDQTLRALGHQQLVFIGTDAPMLTQQHYQEVTSALNNNDIALSHADDGGVVIMANKAPWPTLTNLPWSTNKLSLSLSALCQQKQLSVAYTLSGYDIDYMADIQKLLVDLKNDIRPARQALLETLKQILDQTSAQTLNDLSLSPKVTTHA